MPNRLATQYDDATAAAGAAGRTASGDYLSRIKTFDPMAYLKEGAAAGMEGIAEGYGQTESMRRFSLNRRGLYGSDIGGGQATRDLNTRVAREIAGRSSEAMQAEQYNTAQLGSYAQNQQNTYLDLLTGAMDRETAAKNARKQRWASLAGGLGALAGGLIAGPAGAGIGNAVGQGVGGFF